MVRASHAILVGSVAVVLTALLAFGGGWAAAHAVGHPPLAELTARQSTLLAEPASPPGLQAPAEARGTFAIFWEVWGLVHREFYRTEPLDQQQLTYGAIQGMLAALGDDYTIFQEPAAAERSHESMQGRFEGIGIYLAFEAGSVLVQRPIKGAPAERAGLRSGDAIVRIDGAEVAALIDGLTEAETMDAMAGRIRGPRGSTVVLTIYRPQTGATFDVAIVRDEVPLISVSAQMLDNQLAYIQLTEFKATTTAELDAALRNLLPRQPAGLVLDLRNNPGGYLRVAQEVLGRFYTGTALRETFNDGSTEKIYTISAPGDVQAFDLPLVVLLNDASASAAEIVAGGLRDERPGTLLLGTTSFGKGSVQNIHRLRDGSSVRITVAHWFTPDNQAIHEVGITPDYIVAAAQGPQYGVPCVEHQQPPAGEAQCSDAQLFWGLRLLLGEEPPASTPDPAPTSQANPQNR